MFQLSLSLSILTLFILYYAIQKYIKKNKIQRFSAEKKVNDLNVNINKKPISVNYHFTRQCNYSCGFCFHTAKTSYVPPLEDSKIVLAKLADKGMKKINFAGGEPFLHPKYLEKLLYFCKQELMLESVSIVSNGSKISRNFLQRNKDYLDILAI